MKLSLELLGLSPFAPRKCSCARCRTKARECTHPARKATMLILLLIYFVGCGNDVGDDDGFGRVRSTSGYGAVDGISGFVHLLKSRGLNVRQSSRISPQIERYDTIIWAPDRASPPSASAIERLQRWIDDGYGARRIVFIGPGFRSRKLLEKKQISLAKGEDLERSIRRYQEKLIHRDFGFGPRHWPRNANGEGCEWYELELIDNQPIKSISGPWSNGLAADELELYTGIYNFEIPTNLQPAPGSDEDDDETYIDNDYDYDARAVVLLSGDDLNLVYRIPRLPNYYTYYDLQDDEESEMSGIFVVANGSFLQNYGLVNPGNQELAKKIADVCKGEVLVLQSGPSPIEVTESLAPEKNGWEWLRQRPLREIVPFFLLLATFTFFVVFPIHGRPKRIKLRPDKTFADHIRATGQLLKASKGRDWAKKIIEKHHGSSSDKKSG